METDTFIELSLSCDMCFLYKAFAYKLEKEVYIWFHQGKKKKKGSYILIYWFLIAWKDRYTLSSTH